jgi:iron complex outermembrane receptor protein
MAASFNGAGFTFDVEDSDSWDNTSGSLILAYDLADDVNVYGKVSQGWKSGGFNGEAPTADAFREGYDAEEVMSFEAGIKSRFADDKVQLNASVFYNDISDLQVSVFLEGAGAAASNVDNVGEATFQGLELELVWQLAESVVLSANYGYLDVEYDEFIENGVDVKDAKDIPYAPENTLSVALDWALGNVGFGDLDLHVDWSYNDDYVPYINPDQNATSMIDSYDILNASLILSEVSVGSHSSLQFSLWGKNITDEEYRQNTIPFGLWTISYFGQPATYGFDARLNF